MLNNTSSLAPFIFANILWMTKDQHDDSILSKYGEAKSRRPLRFAIFVCPLLFLSERVRFGSCVGIRASHTRNVLFSYAARSTRVLISLRSITKSMGL